MKRKSRTELLHLADRARSAWRRELRRRVKSDTGISHDAILIVAPQVLSFTDNALETLQFFTEFKNAVFTSEVIRRKGQVFKKPVSVELKTIKRMSLPTAVILAAELHRWSIQRNSNLSLRSYRRWNRRVLALMYSLGVFDLVGIKGFYGDFDPFQEVVLLPLKSGIKRDGRAVDELQNWLKSMQVGFQKKRYVFGALDEAIINGMEHGYISTGAKPLYPYVGHRWWATSCYDPNNNSLRFFVYDQGIGIPGTLPHKADFWPFIQSLLAKLPGQRTDAAIIEAAFEVGKTRTNEEKRGKGLAKMREAIELAGDGYLRIMSGRGDVIMNSDRTLKKTDHNSHIGGTLVEWCIPIVALQEAEHDTQG